MRSEEGKSGGKGSTGPSYWFLCWDWGLGNRRAEGRKAAASRHPLQMIKEVAPHVADKQIGLRKAGLCPSCTAIVSSTGCQVSS